MFEVWLLERKANHRHLSYPLNTSNMSDVLLMFITDHTKHKLTGIIKKNNQRVTNPKIVGAKDVEIRDTIIRERVRAALRAEFIGRSEHDNCRYVLVIRSSGNK